MEKEEYKLSLNEKTNILSVHVSIATLPKHKGVVFYDTVKVLAELKKSGYEVTERDCVQRHKPVRSDYGKNHTSGVWEFQLPLSTEKVEKEPKPKISPIKNTLTKKTSRKKRKSVVE